MPASRSIKGEANSLILFGAYSERKIAVKRHSGIAIATATPVTHNVPIINGKNPNSPLKGCHEDEKSNSDIGFIIRMAFDLRNRPKAIINLVRIVSAALLILHVALSAG